MNWATPKSAKEARRKHFELLQEKIDIRLAQTNPGKDFMSYILENTKERLSNMELVLMSSNFVTAGSGTTANALSATTFYLLKNPEKLALATKEVRDSFQNEEDITMLSSARLPYIRACLQEAMRLLPPAPATFPRFVPGKGEMIDGRWVPGGTAVGVHQLSTGRSKWNFERPDEFIPERWLANSDIDDPDKDASQPFSYGARDCVGRRCAHTSQRKRELC